MNTDDISIEHEPLMLHVLIHRSIEIGSSNVHLHDLQVVADSDTDKDKDRFDSANGALSLPHEVL